MRRKLATLKVFFGYWVRRELLPSSPFWKVRLELGTGRKLTRTLSRKEAGQLLTEAHRQALIHRHGRDARDFLALRNLALVEVLLFTGLRVGEVASLRTVDLLDNTTLRVRGKGNRERLAFLTDARTEKALAGYLAAREKLDSHSQAMFLAWPGSALSTQGIARVVRLTATRAGIARRVTPHMLRHTVATHLLRDGADIRVVQEFLGHASITTTQRYTHISKSHMEETLRRHHPRGRSWATAQFCLPMA